MGERAWSRDGEGERRQREWACLEDRSFVWMPRCVVQSDGLNEEEEQLERWDRPVGSGLAGTSAMCYGRERERSEAARAVIWDRCGSFVAEKQNKRGEERQKGEEKRKEKRNERS